MTPSNGFVAVDANWESSREIYGALAAYLPGVLIEAREWSQAVQAGWLRRGQLRLRQLSGPLWRKRYALPMGWFHSLNWLSMPLLARSIVGQSTRALGEFPGVWIFSSPYYLRMLEVVRPEFAVYHPVDDYRWYWPRMSARTTSLEMAILSRVDLVVCVSSYNRDRLRKLCPDDSGKVVHVPNGAPERFYRKPSQDSVARWRARLAVFVRPHFAYIGDPLGRVDFGMVRALAAATTGTILFAGPESSPEPLKKHRNIEAIGSVPPDEVPAFLQAVDVLLIPQVDSEFNRATSPKKLWEYCASGKPIVGACLTEIDPGADGIRVATSESEFVQQALGLAGGGDSALESEARHRLARNHTYPVLARRLFDHLAAIRPDLQERQALPIGRSQGGGTVLGNRSARSDT